MWVVMEDMEWVLGVGGNGDSHVFILCTALYCKLSVYSQRKDGTPPHTAKTECAASIPDSHAHSTLVTFWGVSTLSRALFGAGTRSGRLKKVHVVRKPRPSNHGRRRTGRNAHYVLQPLLQTFGFFYILIYSSTLPNSNRN